VNKVTVGYPCQTLLWIAVLLVALHAEAQIPIKQDSINKSGNKRTLFAFPAIIHSPELSFAFGGAGNYYFRMGHDSTVRTSFIQALGLISLRKQLVFGVESTIFFPNERYLLRTQASVSHFPDRFWGLGNTSEAANREKYTIGQYFLFPQLLRKLRNNLFLGVAYEFQNVFFFDYGNGKPAGESIFDQENVAGRNGSIVSGLGLIFLYDGRNNTFNSSSGYYFSYYINQFTPVLGSQFTFLSQSLDARKYIPVGEKYVLAFQVVGNFAHGDVPVRSLFNIGSSSMLRGYYEGRYADKNLLAAQTEFRAPIIWRIGVVGFAGVGRVSHTLSQMSFSALKESYGLGLRYSVDKKEKLNLRLDFGWGKHSNGIYFNLAEAF